MEIFYLGVNKFKYIGNCFDKGLVEQILEVLMNREPTGNLVHNWQTSNFTSIGKFEKCVVF